MPAIWELVASRDITAGESASARLMFMAGRSVNEAEILAMAEAESPPTFADLVRQRIHCQHRGAGVWEIQVDYGLKSQDAGQSNPQQDQGNQTGSNDALSPDIKISCRGQTEHITQSLRTVQTAKVVGDNRQIPDYKGAIGVHKGAVAGCDIMVPASTWSESWLWKSQFITWGVIGNWDRLVGRVNFNIFRTRSPGEVMFEGYESEPHGAGQRRVVYSFKRQPGVQQLKIIPTMGPVDKAGWQWIWVDYEDAAAADSIPIVPRCVYVEEVGRPGNFLDVNGNLALAGTPTNLADFSDPNNGLGIGK